MVQRNARLASILNETAMQDWVRTSLENKLNLDRDPGSLASGTKVATESGPSNVESRMVERCGDTDRIGSPRRSCQPSPTCVLLPHVIVMVSGPVSSLVLTYCSRWLTLHVVMKPRGTASERCEGE